MDNNNIVNPTDIQLQDEIVVQIKRVSKATTGGRRMGFSAIVGVGDGKNHSFSTGQEVIMFIRPESIFIKNENSILLKAFFRRNYSIFFSVLFNRYNYIM